MSYQSNYVRGSWKCICESCGRIVKAGELRQRWDGFMVDERCWEPRQPQDFVRGVADYQAPPFTRPESSDVFIPTTYIYDPDGLLPIEPLVSQSTATINIGRPKTIISNILTSLASIVTAIYPKAASNKTLNGNPLNTNTLG